LTGRAARQKEIKYRERSMWVMMGGWWALTGIFSKANTF
jgi:hypothetical protein